MAAKTASKPSAFKALDEIMAKVDALLAQRQDDHAAFGQTESSLSETERKLAQARIAEALGEADKSTVDELKAERESHRATLADLAERHEVRVKALKAIYERVERHVKANLDEFIAEGRRKSDEAGAALAKIANDPNYAKALALHAEAVDYWQRLKSGPQGIGEREFVNFTTPDPRPPLPGPGALIRANGLPPELVGS